MGIIIVRGTDLMTIIFFLVIDLLNHRICRVKSTLMNEVGLKEGV